ncbi:MAG: YeeE/YedE family protein [Proteobacteria bacterium]|nr:YeeE/YedE family protein [Pseudomonadota bacterium]
MNMKTKIRKYYIAVFEQEWPSWLAGILVAIIALMMFLWQSPWGIAAGLNNWGDWLYYLVGAYKERPVASWLHPVSLSDAGIVIGAFVSALMARQFKIHPAPKLEYAKGIAGGILMGAGASMAKGCNVGGFFSAVAMMSAGGFAMMIGLGAGAWVGLRYLLWEMEHIPSQTVYAKPKDATKAKTFDWLKIQPYIGVVVAIGIVVVFYTYAFLNKTQLGGWLFFGFLIGMVMHRSRFCFVRPFRDPFMTGEAKMVKVVAISIIIYFTGTAVIKWAYLQEPSMGVYHPFVLGSLMGGFIFGIGMILAGGCASGTLWRVGEGQTKLMVTLVTFVLTNSLVSKVLLNSNLYKKLGQDMFIPDILTWQITIPFMLVFFLVWVLVAMWNEETEKFVIF